MQIVTKHLAYVLANYLQCILDSGTSVGNMQYFLALSAIYSNMFSGKFSDMSFAFMCDIFRHLPTFIQKIHLRISVDIKDLRPKGRGTKASGGVRHNDSYKSIITDIK